MLEALRRWGHEPEDSPRSPSSRQGRPPADLTTAQDATDATDRAAAAGESHDGEPWPGEWRHMGVGGGTAPAAMQARSASSASAAAADLPVLALTAPATVWDEVGALERPPFRLLTDAAVAGTLRRPGAWSARARRVQSHACAADTDADSVAGECVDGGRHEDTEAVEEMVAASAMLALAESLGVEEGGPLAADLMEALSSMGEAAISVDAAVAEVPEYDHPAQEAERVSHGSQIRVTATPGGGSGGWPQGDAMRLVQQSRLWAAASPPEMRAFRAHSMPNADMPAWHASPGHAGTAAAATSVPLCSVQEHSHAGASDAYRGIADISPGIASANSPPPPVGVRERRGAEDAGPAYRGHAYTGTLDRVKDEFILDESELESDA